MCTCKRMRRLTCCAPCACARVCATAPAPRRARARRRAQLRAPPACRARPHTYTSINSSSSSSSNTKSGSPLSRGLASGATCLALGAPHRGTHHAATRQYPRQGLGSHARLPARRRPGSSAAGQPSGGAAGGADGSPPYTESLTRPQMEVAGETEGGATASRRERSHWHLSR